MYNSASVSAPEFSLLAIDVDADGQSELWRAIENTDGSLNILTLAHRSGDKLVDFYNSGDLFSDHNADIRSVLVVGDTNGDGSMELAVVQGTFLHILETSSDSTAGTLGGLINKISTADLPNGIENALLSKLNNAQKAFDQGNIKSFKNHLKSFANQVEAQSGKQIPADVAQELIVQAEKIISSMNS